MTQSSPIERKIAPQYDARGNPVWKAQMSAPDNSVAKMDMVPDRIIPVIFVPGVMGSNLKGIGRATGTSWTLNSTASMLPWLSRGPEARKTALTPSTMIVDDEGKLPSGTSQTPEELKRRGWGEVGAMSYSEFLVWLENALNDFDQAKDGLRASLIGKSLSVLTGEAALTRDEVALSYRYRFPVHACGYNWLDSNAKSGERLGKRIDEVIARYRSEKRKCEKVIVVTHSMGGLVARHCSEVLGYRDKIFGVVHGVMPAIGAAAVYRRFKAGTEGPAAASKVLGENAAEMTAVLSSAPGPMQLLPTPEYGNGWLKVRDGGNVVSLPQQGDPYGEIYTVRGKWWSMCEDRLINPLNKEADPKKRQAQVDADWIAFAGTIRKDVEVFHGKVKGKYHAATHAFIGQSDKHKAYGTVSWDRDTHLDHARARANMPVPKMQEIMAADDTPWRGPGATTPDLLGKNRNPAFEAGGKPYTEKFRISDPDEPGDGTVPHRSGIAPKVHCKSMLQVEVEHEPAYKRMQWRRQRACVPVHIARDCSDSAGSHSNGAEVRMSTRRHFLRHTGALVTFVSGWSLSACSPKVPSMTEQEAKYIDQLMQRAQTRSVGRYLIELPEVFVASTEAQSVIDQVDAQIRPMDRLVFDSAIQRREAELRKKHMDGEPENPFLKRIESLSGAHSRVRVFNRAEGSGSADFARTLELWAWKDGYLIQLSVNANESEGTAYASEAWIKDFPTDTPQKLDHLLHVFSRVRGRKDNEIPTDQGDCIANGFVAGPPSAQQAINVSYQLQGSPDLYFNFNHTTAVRERDTLLERTAQVESEMQSSGTQTVRKGQRDINGLPYEEWLMRGPTPNGVPGTMFMLHGNETASDPAKPFVELGLFNGFRVPAPERTLEESAMLKNLEKASLTEALALGLWDRVTATLRVRPGAF